MPRHKLLQSSGAKKRQIAKERAAKDRLSVETAPKLDRFFVHSKVKVCDDSPEAEAPQHEDGERSHSESVLSRQLLMPGPRTAEFSVTSIETEVANATVNASDSEPESQPRVHDEVNVEDDDEHEDEAIQHGN